MPSLDDLPILAALGAAAATPVSAGDLLPLYDVSAATAGNGGRSSVKRTTVGVLRGAGAGESTTVSGTSATISTPITVCTSTSAVALTLPAASGDLRKLYVLKASITSAITVSRAGSDVIVSGTSVSATSVSVTAGLAAIFISDGTTWYHVSNDA